MENRTQTAGTKSGKEAPPTQFVDVQQDKIVVNWDAYADAVINFTNTISIEERYCGVRTP